MTSILSPTAARILRHGPRPSSRSSRDRKLPPVRSASGSKGQIFIAVKPSDSRLSRQLVGAVGEGDLVVVGAFGPVVRADLAARDGARVVVVAGAGVVGADAVATGPAQQLIDRLAHGLAEDVPQRHVDDGGRTDLRARAGEAEIARHQVLVVELDGECILAQQIGRDQLVNLGLDRERAARGLAQPDQALRRCAPARAAGWAARAAGSFRWR